MRDLFCAACVVAMLLVTGASAAQDANPTPGGEPAATAMDNARLGALIQRLDPKSEGGAGNWQLYMPDEVNGWMRSIRASLGRRGR